MTGATVFYEVQRTSGIFSVLVLGLVTASYAIIAFTLPASALLSFWPYILISLALIIAVFATVKMETNVGEEGVHISTLYFWRRFIGFNQIDDAEAVQYSPILDYGGWGVRISHKGKAYNMRGRRGVQLALKNGGRVLIGSQRDEELAIVIQSRLQ
jgi:hypothetical protein